MIITTYKDCEVDCDQFGFFRASGVEGWHFTLAAIKEAIDKASKIKYEKIDGLIIHHGLMAMKLCTITRPAITNGYVWVIYDDKSRETPSRAYPRTLENVSRAIRIIELNKQVLVLQSQVKSEVLLLEKLNIETWPTL